MRTHSLFTSRKDRNRKGRILIRQINLEDVKKALLLLFDLCKKFIPRLGLIMVLLGTLLTLFYFLALDNAATLLVTTTSSTLPRLSARTSENSTEVPGETRFDSFDSVERETTEDGRTVDSRYFSAAAIKWNHISEIIDGINLKNEYRTIGLLNFENSEIHKWKQLQPNTKYVVLHLDHVAANITWESLYPEWIDEEEESEVPTCPELPKVRVPEEQRFDIVAVKLPCNKSGGWSRDVARLHLQLAAADVAASAKSIDQVFVLLVTECFPVPNLFTCKELVLRNQNLWIYRPNLTILRKKLQLPIGSCELAVPLKAKENLHSKRARREAYATILHSTDVYVCGAIAAARSIRKSGSTRDLVVLIDETISDHHRRGLQGAGWKIHTIKRIRNPKAEQDAYNEWNYSKFRLWQLTDYEKVIFIDADQLILRNIDFLFELPEISASVNSAVRFNSGMMVVEPSNCTFQLLMEQMNEIESNNGGDQGYLNEVFTWWHRIPRQMNFLKQFWRGDEKKIKKMKTQLFGANPPILYVLHYLGNKPWQCFRDYDCNWNVEKLHEFASDVAHRTWWKIHDTMPKNLKSYCLLSTKQKAALEWDRRQAEEADFKDGHWKIKIRDRRLRTCFENFCSWKTMLKHWNATPSIQSPPSLITMT